MRSAGSRAAAEEGLLGEERSVRWIAHTEALAEALEGIGAGPLAVDTEADSFHHYREKICLIQLSFGTNDLLIDPLAEIDLEPLREPLGDPRLPTVMHGADYDVRLLGRCCGLEVRGLFDTMIAARLAGETAFGLSSLLERHFGVVLDKRFQRADWSVRPLTDEMKRYAVLDTRHLIELAALLRERLESEGRGGWAAEEFLRLEQVRWQEDEGSRERWHKIKGAGKLPRETLAVVRELAALRDEVARQRDRPLFRILRDDALLELARLGPTELRELERVSVLPRRWRTGADARALLEAVARARALPPESWPERPPRKGRPPTDPALNDRVQELRDGRDELAGRLGLDPAIIAPRAVLEGVARAELEGSPIEKVGELRAWQRELIEPLVQRGGGDVP